MKAPAEFTALDAREDSTPAKRTSQLSKGNSIVDFDKMQLDKSYTNERKHDDQDDKIPVKSKYLIKEALEAQRKMSLRKNYEQFDGNHNFCCAGHCMYGPGSESTALSWFVLNACNVVVLLEQLYEGKPLVELISQVVLWFFANVFLVVTAFSDPGIVPR